MTSDEILVVPRQCPVATVLPHFLLYPGGPQEEQRGQSWVEVRSGLERLQVLAGRRGFELLAHCQLGLQHVAHHPRLARRDPGKGE